MDQLSLFRLFVAIAERGSLIGASRALAIAPSMATLGLKRLEEMVGVMLVFRTTRRLTLTQEGERFLVDCQRILMDIEDAIDSLSDGGPLRGEIKVTATNDFGRTTLAPLIDIFMNSHPEVRIALMLGDTVIDLAENGYDLALRLGSFGESRPGQQLLISGARQVCASPAYWSKAGKPQHPDELEKHNCVLLARPDSPKTVWHFRENNKVFGVSVSGDRTANEGETLRNWALAGAGVVLKSSIDIIDDVANGRLIPVLTQFELDAVNPYNLYAITLTGRRQPRRVKALVDFLAEKLRKD